MQHDCTDFTPTANPGGGKGIVPCSSDSFLCEYNGCLQNNFSIAQGEIFLRENQNLNGTPSNAASTSQKIASSSPTPKPSPTISSTSCSPNATPAQSLPVGASGKLAAVGAGVGAPLAVALLVAARLLLLEKRRSRALNAEKHQLTAEADHYKREVDLQRVWTANQNGGIYEVSAVVEPAELHSRTPRH